MIALGIFAGVVSVVGIVKAVQLVSTDGYGPAPTNVHPTMFSIR